MPPSPTPTLVGHGSDAYGILKAHKNISNLFPFWLLGEIHLLWPYLGILILVNPSPAEPGYTLPLQTVQREFHGHKHAPEIANICTIFTSLFCITGVSKNNRHVV